LAEGSTASLTSEVRRLAVPAILHSLLQTFVFVVDRIMLGRHGEASLAAMQLGGAIEWSIWSIFSAFEVGTIARIGRHVGAKDPARARRAALLSLAMAMGLGIVLALATPLVLAALPRVASRVSPAAMGEARNYLGVTIAASPLVFVAATAIATLQAAGDTKTPLAIGIVGNVVHIGLNRVLILGAFGIVPALGARGAGISTSITFALEAVLALLALVAFDPTKRAVSLRRPRDAPALAEPHTPSGVTKRAKTEARALLHVALPSFFERLFYHIGYVGYVLVIARLGDAAMAANQSLISIESICFLSADGFGIAAAAIVAQKLGAKKPEEAKRAAFIATRYAVISLTAFGLAAVALQNVILPLFGGDGRVLAIGKRTIPVLALAQPFMATGIVLAQALRGAGRTREVLVASTIGAVVVRLGATWLFAMGLGLGLIGVWLGSTTDWIVRSALFVALQRRNLKVPPAEAEAAASAPAKAQR